MELATGLTLLVAFLVVVVLIVRGQSPVIMLLLLAIVWAALAGIGINDIQAKILQGGGVQYASSVIIIVFGAWFAQVLIQTGIAESVIRSAAELAGDRPLVTAIVINLVTALLFTSMYGVGAAIAIGVVALPIMMSQGIPAARRRAGVHHGRGRRDLRQSGAVRHVQAAVPGHQVRSSPGSPSGSSAWRIYVLCAWVMIYLNLRKLGVRHAASVDIAEPAPPARKRTPYYTYLVPLFPVVMIMVFKWQIIPTFLLSIVLALVLTWKDRSLQGHLNLFNKSFYDAFPGHRDHRGAVDHLRHDHRGRPDAAGLLRR